MATSREVGAELGSALGTSDNQRSFEIETSSLSRKLGCVGWLFFSFGLDSMLVAFLCQIQLGPARLAKTTQSPQRGRAALLFRTTPATIYIIANTGAMLDFGQKRTIGIAALVAEPGCDLILAAPDSARTFEL
jgi:hypothetical protein